MTVASELQKYLAAAAATLTAPTAPAVLGGEQDNVSVPTVAYWYTGTKTWQANTFSATQELSCWHIRVYMPAPARYSPNNASIEAWLEGAVSAIRGQLWGHYSLEGASTGTGSSLSDAVAGWAQLGGQWCRLADMDLEVMQTAVHTITA